MEKGNLHPFIDLRLIEGSVVENVLLTSFMNLFFQKRQFLITPKNNIPFHGF